MGGKDSSYQIVYRGEVLNYRTPGEWVLFQRPKKCGGGYWLGKAYDMVFMLEPERPVSLREGIEYIQVATRVVVRMEEFDDDQFGLPF